MDESSKVSVDMPERPILKALKACAEWLRYCKEAGWKPEQLDKLEKLWWEHHDNYGNLTAAAPQPPEMTGDTSDGYHTFNELYAFRRTYNAALFNEWAVAGKYQVHKSFQHHDGEPCFGGSWFIAVAVLPSGQISNHYKAEHWEQFKIPSHERALFPYDGHSAKDTLDRLAMLAAAPANELAELERDLAHHYAFDHIEAVLNDDSLWVTTVWVDGKHWAQEGCVWSGVIRYLELRGLIERHPTDTNLVRVKNEGQQEQNEFEKEAEFQREMAEHAARAKP